MTTVRTGQAPPMLDRAAFGERFRQRYADPIFDPEAGALARIEAIAWQAYEQGRKAPRTAKAGPGYADPDYALSVDWIASRRRIDAAQARQRDPSGPARVLVICCSPRNDGTCPGEVSKTWRLATHACTLAEAAGAQADLLDLSRLTSEPDLHIHPCKACVSTAMPLCHWPCSCYPNHGNGQVNDWMDEIYERWAAAHGVLIVTPVHWYQAPSPLKLMIDRLVCADGGNPDPTLTGGKDAAKAKAIELAGWDYPKHLAGRLFGLVVHGDVDGVEGVRQSLTDWLEWMGLIRAGSLGLVGRYIGYWEPYATSHDALDADAALLEEVALAARAVVQGIGLRREGRLESPDAGLRSPRPK
ncbi:MAG: flavodoxin family protein [Burkholderiales bacterium]|nr:MAG: flavodoxin family protein [Burkholderiales bacterium]